MSVDRCSRCSALVDTDNEPEAYVGVTGYGGQPEWVCLCRWHREEHEEGQEREQSRPMPANIDAMIEVDIASDPRNSCKECDWDVDGCSPCPEHADL